MTMCTSKDNTLHPFDIAQKVGILLTGSAKGERWRVKR